MAQRSDPFERLLGEAARAGVYPGAAWAVGDARTTLSAGAVGPLDPARPEEPTLPDTLFDVASLTKVLAVWGSSAPSSTPGSSTSAPRSARTGRRPRAAARRGHRAPPPHPHGGPAAARQPPAPVRLRSAGRPRRRPRRAAPAPARGGRRVHRPGGADPRLPRRAPHPAAAPPARRRPGLDAPRHDGDPVRAAARRDAAALRPTEYDEESGARSGARSTTSRPGCSAAPAGSRGLHHHRRHRPVPAAPARPGARHLLRRLDRRLAARPHRRARPPRGLFWHPAPGTEPAEDVWAHFGFTGTALWVSPARGRWAVLLTNRLRLTRDPGPLARVRDAFRALAFPRG
ncbi:serine hydrolase [Streptomyces diastatochromogenes]|nr:serine hydrolase [Streptomyces diastatochromogenes]